MTKSTKTAPTVKMGPNMKKMFDFATANAGWHTLGKGRDNSRALTSLVKSKALVSRTVGDVVQFAVAGTKSKAAPKVIRSTAAKSTVATVRPESNFAKALEYAQANPDRSRKDLVALLIADLGLSAAGASTYASAVRKRVAASA